MKNDKYLKNMVKLQRLFNDLKGPLQYLEEARIYTERVIKTKGKNLEFKFKGETLTVFQVHNSDLIFFLCVFIFIFYFK